MAACTLKWPSSCNQDHRPAKPTVLTIQPFIEKKFTDPYSMVFFLGRYIFSFLKGWGVKLKAHSSQNQRAINRDTWQYKKKNRHTWPHATGLSSQGRHQGSVPAGRCSVQADIPKCLLCARHRGEHPKAVHHRKGKRTKKRKKNRVKLILITFYSLGHVQFFVTHGL